LEYLWLDAGVDPWLDTERPGQIWRTTIDNAIKNSRYFIALISSNFVKERKKRGYVQQELKEAVRLVLLILI